MKSFVCSPVFKDGLRDEPRITIVDDDRVVFRDHMITFSAYVPDDKVVVKNGKGEVIKIIDLAELEGEVGA